MSTAVSAGVWMCGPGDMAAKFLLLAIADNADDFGFAFPSVETLAAKIACDARTVQRHLVALEEQGWLRVGRKLINGKGNAYFIDLSKIGVRLSPDARKSPMFMRLEKMSHDRLSRIFLATKSDDSGEISDDNPQPPQTTQTGTQTTKTGGSDDTAMGVKPLEPSKEPSGEPSEDVQPNLPPTPLRGEAAERFERVFQGLKSRVKEHVQGNGLGVAARRARPIRADCDDYDACFRDWWGLDARVLAGTFWLITEASDRGLTEAGLHKYAARLEFLVREMFALHPRLPVRFAVRQLKTQTPAA